MNSTTPEIIGCVGGSGVTCVTASAMQTRSRSKHAMKLSSSSKAMQCPFCCSVGKGNCASCCAESPMSNLAETDAAHKAKGALEGGAVEEVNGSSAEKRWYTGMLRGALLGRWRGKRNARSPRGKVVGLQSGVSSVSSSPDTTNNTTNNNSKTSNRPLHMHENSSSQNQTISQSKSGSTGTANTNDSNECGKKPDAAGGCDNQSVTSSGTLLPRPTIAERKLKSEGRPRQTLPSLPYRDSDSESKGMFAMGGDGNKRRKGRRKYFHPQSHKKITQDHQNSLSTYVSFQEEFADDIYMNIASQQSIASSSASPATQRSCSTTDSSLQVSPSSIADDVFADSCIRRSEDQDGSESSVSKEELEDARIANLFRKVNIAFEKRSSDVESMVSSNLLQDQRTPESRIQGAEYPTATNVKSAPKGERIEAIMASANLQASLDNALTMLSESTKLLSTYDRSGMFGASRHPPYSAGFFQSTRSRTCSTCSRLAPIAEENFRPVADGADAGDDTSNTFCGSSECEKFGFATSTSADSFGVQGAMNQRDSFHSVPSAGQNRTETRWRASCSATARAKELDSKLKWLISTSNVAPRGSSNSYSTISVRSLHKQKGFAENLSEPGRTEKCAACDWALRARPQAPVSVIPSSAWSGIVKDVGNCHDHAHSHPWSMCTEQLSPPVLCHSHYLQCYQFLQNDQMSNGSVRHLSSPGAAIDDDIPKVSSSISDDLVAASADGRYVPLPRFVEHAVSNYGQTFANLDMDTQFCSGHGYRKHSYNDMSGNSDSAFSTNGSPTPSTRDGVNTDGESIGSIQERLETRGLRSSNDPWMRVDELGRGNISRGKRTQSYEDALAEKGSAEYTVARYDQRYSLVSSLCSYSHPLTPDALCDSAVHLQDSASSRSTRTRLSSDSFYSSGTSLGDKEPGLIDGPLVCEGLVNVFSRSSSETSLKSEGTLCLSEFAMSQQNVSLFSVPSFPRISDLCSPTRRGTLQRTVSREEQFEDWVKSAKVTENMLESFLNSSLAQLQASSEKPASESSEKSSSGYSTKHATDTLTSSSGSSDTNTLGSGSSGSTFAASSLRSYGRFNTLGSSSCVSTDDTGETVIDQFMLRQGEKLHDIEEMPTAARKQHKLTKKRRSDRSKRKYKPSVFHYQHLEVPPFPDESLLLQSNKGVIDDQINVTDDEKTDRVIQSLAKKDEARMESLKIPLSPIQEFALQSRVQTMMQSCADFDAVIASLRESLKSSSCEATDNFLNQKLLELGRILKQKDEMINQLHSMLLACSMQKNHIGQNLQLNATM